MIIKFSFHLKTYVKMLLAASYEKTLLYFLVSGPIRSQGFWLTSSQWGLDIQNYNKVKQGKNNEI